MMFLKLSIFLFFVGFVVTSLRRYRIAKEEIAKKNREIENARKYLADQGVVAISSLIELVKAIEERTVWVRIEGYSCPRKLTVLDGTVKLEVIIPTCRCATCYDRARKLHSRLGAAGRWEGDLGVVEMPMGLIASQEERKSLEGIIRGTARLCGLTVKKWGLLGA